jgi:hypothetical protein
MVCASYFAPSIKQARGRDLHIHGDHLQPAHEVVVQDRRRDGDEHARRGGDERLGDAAGDDGGAAGAGGREVAEGLDDADDGAEQAD